MAKFWYDTFEIPEGVAVLTVARPEYDSGKAVRVTFQDVKAARGLATSLEKAAAWLRETALELAASGEVAPEVDEKILSPRAE